MYRISIWTGPTPKICRIARDYEGPSLVAPQAVVDSLGGARPKGFAIREAKREASPWASGANGPSQAPSAPALTVARQSLIESQW